MSEKLRLVKFADGRWGIQRIDVGTLMDVFLDFNNTEYWWGAEHGHFRYCKVEESSARDALRNIRHKAKVALKEEEARKLAATYEVMDE
jgi:hypothetical protein